MSPLLYDPKGEHTCDPPKFANNDRARKGAIWSCAECNAIWEFADDDFAGMHWYRPKPWNLRFRRHMRRAAA